MGHLHVDSALGSVKRDITEAAAYLFVDGPVSGFPPSDRWDTLKGEKLQGIINNAFRPGNVFVWFHGEPDIRSEFEAVIDILSEASGQNLCWLKDFIGKHPNEIIERAKKEWGRDKINLTREQIAFLENRGFMTQEQFFQALEKEDREGKVNQEPVG